MAARSLSRRSVISSAAAAALISPVLPRVARAQPPSQLRLISDGDGEILKRFYEWKELSNLERETYAAVEELEERAQKEYPPLPSPFNTWFLDDTPPSYICVLIKGRIDSLEKREKTSKRITEFRALADDYETNFDIVRERHGLPEAHAKHERLVEQLGGLEEAILRTPSHGSRGVLVKLLIWHSHTPDFDRTDFNCDFVLSSMVDLNRLTDGILDMPDDVSPETFAA